MGNEIQKSGSRAQVPGLRTDEPRTYLDRSSQGRSEAGVDLSRISHFLRRRWRTVLWGFLAVLAGSVALTLLLPRIYESSVTFLVEQRNGRTDLPALSVLDRLGRLASRETEMELIRSRRVVGLVVDRLNLHVSIDGGGKPRRPGEVFPVFEADPEAVPGEYHIERRSDDGSLIITDSRTGRQLGAVPETGSLSFLGLRFRLPSRSPDTLLPLVLEVSPFAEAVDKTRERISVASVHRDADIVAMTCSARSPEDAQLLCRSVSDSYMELRTELQQAEATAAATFLGDQVVRVEERLRAAEDSLQAYAERTRSVALSSRATEEVRQNAALWAQREQVKAERAALSTLIVQVSAAESGSRRYRELASFPTFLTQDNGLVTSLVENLVELESRRSDLAVRRSESDVELAALDRRIREIEIQLYSIATVYERALATQVASLDQALENSGSVLSRIPKLQVETARLERQTELLGDLYMFLETRLREAQIAQAVELPGVRIVDRASLPYKPASPNRRIALAVGFLLASSFGLILGILAEYSDTRIRERSQVEGDTGVPVLSMLPGLKRPGLVIAVSIPGRNGGRTRTLAPEWNEERELALEAFRSLAAEIGFVGRRLSERGIRSVAITSSVRGEGKTLAACNLAIARASHGARVLLIDADLRGHGVSRFFQLDKDLAGLIEYCSSDNNNNVERFSQLLIVAGRNRLHVLSAGEATSHSAEVLESDRFRRLLVDGEGDYDLIVVDTPPLSLVTDAATVASLSDGVVVVVRSGMTDRNALDFTLNRLERAGASVAGILLNDVDSLPAYYRTYSHGA